VATFVKPAPEEEDRVVKGESGDDRDLVVYGVHDSGVDQGVDRMESEMELGTTCLSSLWSKAQFSTLISDASYYPFSRCVFISVSIVFCAQSYPNMLCPVRPIISSFFCSS
jgi:hypothetical protein